MCANLKKASDADVTQSSLCLKSWFQDGKNEFSSSVLACITAATNAEVPNPTLRWLLSRNRPGPTIAAELVSEQFLHPTIISVLNTVAESTAHSIYTNTRLYLQAPLAKYPSRQQRHRATNKTSQAPTMHFKIFDCTAIRL